MYESPERVTDVAWVERDATEEVVAAPREPGAASQAARLEGVAVGVQLVDDLVAKFWWDVPAELVRM